MSNRVTTVDRTALREIFSAWVAAVPKLPDEERTIDAALRALEEPNTHWYRLPRRSFLILRYTIPGRSAVVQIINTGDGVFPDPRSTREVLTEAMQEWQLKRLTVISPSELPWRDYKLLGFKHEGRLRKAMLFNGEWTDAETLGALEDEVGIPRRRRRKRRRKNRGAEETSGDGSIAPPSGTPEEGNGEEQ